MQRPISAAILCVIWAVLAGPAQGEGPSGPNAMLVSDPDAAGAYRYDVVVEAAGDLSFKDGDKLKTVPTSVAARLTYDARRRPRDASGAAVCAFQSAEAKIQVDKTPVQPRLRGDRNLIVVEPTDAQPVYFSPLASLSSEELELLQVPFAGPLVDRLLPGKDAAVGDNWKHEDTLLAGLLNLDAVSLAEVTSTVTAVEDGAVRIELGGTAHGALGGVAAEFDLEGRYKFDRKLQRITWLAVVIKEKRSIGHVEPGVAATTRLQMTIAPTATPTDLADAALEELDLHSKPDYLLLDYASTEARFGLRHDRRWHVMTDAREVLSLRFVDRGELVAQCNVRSIPVVDETRRPTAAQFQADVRRSIDKHFRQFARVSESENSLGHTIYRAEAIGDVEGLEIHWIYYLVLDREGRQAVFAFTCEQPMLERLGDADQRLIETLRFLDPPTTAGEPTRAPERR